MMEEKIAFINVIDDKSFINCESEMTVIGNNTLNNSNSKL